MEQESLALRENEITRTALGFLKAHYRQRNRIGNTELSSDLRGAGGIIADGFLRYPVKGGKHFIATIEATSEDSKEEVTFKIQKELLRWDAAATATTLVAVGFVTLYLREMIDIRWLTYAGTIAILIIVSSLLFFLLYRMLGKKRRYRYIYAIEQFKQYYADEQWIALADDVFPPLDAAQEAAAEKEQLKAGRHAEEGKYLSAEYQELVHQCIHNGIGLMIVPRDSPPIIKITPSREDIFKNKRKRIRLIPKTELARLARLGRFPEWMRGIKTDDLLRYQRKYKYQGIVCLISILIIGGVFYEDSLIVEEKEVDYAQHVQEMQELMKKNRNIIEPQFYYLDTPYVWPRPIRKDIQGYALNLGLETASSSELPENIIRFRENRTSNDFITASRGINDLITYDCSRLYNLSQTSYIVQLGSYPTFEEATQRINELRSYGFECNGLRLECFDELEGGYALYFGVIYQDIHFAQRALLTYETLIADNPLKLKLRLRSLSPVQ
jgi:hypothetical protein